MTREQKERAWNLAWFLLGQEAIEKMVFNREGGAPNLVDKALWIEQHHRAGPSDVAYPQAARLLKFAPGFRDLARIARELERRDARGIPDPR